MWVTPKEKLVAGGIAWSTQRANPHFVLQKRKGRSGTGNNVSGLLVGTWDTVFDRRPPQYRYVNNE